MTDDTNALTESEAKYFETQGKMDLPEPEVVEAEKPDPEKVEKAEPEVKAEPDKDKTPTEIEVVDESEVDEEPDGRKFVKVGALRKEREKAKTLKLEVQQEKQARAALEARLKALESPPRQLQPEEFSQVALEEVREVKRALAENAAKQQFIGNYQAKAQEFIGENPDFPAAYKHAIDARRAMFESVGYAPQQVAALLESEEAAIVERAFLDGENPAKRIYALAKTLGYQAKAKEADPVEKQVNRQADTADKTLEAAKKLEKIAKGMDKNKSLAGSGGGNEAPSLEELVAMDEDEFSKHTSGKKFRELMDS